MTFSARAHMWPAMILSTVLRASPLRFAMLFRGSPLSLASRIFAAIAAVIFFPRFGDTEPSSLPSARACLKFSSRVHHSRFVAALFAFTKSIWFTGAAGSGGAPRKASATSRWTFLVDCLSFCERLTPRYPRLSGVCLKILPRLRAVPIRIASTLSRLRTLPKELTSYDPSYPVTARHSSLFIGEL